MPADHHQRVAAAAVNRPQRDTRQVDCLQQVGVTQFGGQAHPENVEGAQRTMGFPGEGRNLVVAHQSGQIRPDGEAALGQDPIGLIQHLV